MMIGHGLVMAGQLLLALGLLVFIHELGHFLAARAFGIKVDKFFIFFDFNGIKLYSKTIGDTEYGIGWFPLGGYVKIAGMIDESLDIEQLSSEPQPWEFRSKPAWQRFIVMMGGIFMNIILGVLIFSLTLFHYQKEYLDPTTVKDGIYAYKIGQEVGFRTGDKIVSINGKVPERSMELGSSKMLMGANVEVNRNGKDTTIKLPDNLFRSIGKSKGYFIAFDNHPFTVDSLTTIYDGTKDSTAAIKMGLKVSDSIVSVNNEPIAVFGDLRNALMKFDSSKLNVVVKRAGQLDTLHVDTLHYGALGFQAGPKKPYETKPYTLANSFRFGLQDGFETIYYQAVGLGKIFTGKVPARESLSSPIGIAQIYGSKWDWAWFWHITGFISLVLAFMNFLPIPALDGGHVMFIVIEVIQGKPVSEKFLEGAQKVGIFILLGLMVFAFGNDLLKLFLK